ncbi:TetR/AcrR family transcriptional regulator [Agromyces sp. NBRC 114283]|uniref:TetR/AcrR family transcriptional regulator n=1 Tax=Agromyces sp. NBRC 114283 TaxID=2994521 RepID=UPI00249FBC6B|nr:TetR/AcrR family transcriptional regulator [Agromyces sp. NBRC 114283]GLU88733.1 TetR family transcriptional regulator [Agromyces sp. NBRC 114283]
MTTEARRILIEAAQELYAANGVAATTPREVLARSGVGQGSLYHHFPSKRDLAAAAVAQTVDDTLGSAAATLDGADEPQRRIADYLERPRAATAGCRVGRLTADPVVMGDEALRGEVSRYFAELIELVARAFTEQGLDAAAARDRATTAVAVIQGGYVLSRALGDDAAMRAAVRGLLELLEPAPTGHEERSRHE